VKNKPNPIMKREKVDIKNEMKEFEKLHQLPEEL